jgi:hypothetical protein
MRNAELFFSAVFIVALAGCTDVGRALTPSHLDAAVTLPATIGPSISAGAPDASPPDSVDAAVAEVAARRSSISVDVACPEVAAAPAYPSTDIGGRPRSSTQAGQRFPNLTLVGISSAATINTPVTVSMADYYDPAGSRYDLLHIMAIFMWCPHCNNETTVLSKIAGWQSDHRVAALQIAMEGYGSASATWAELQKWVGDHNLNVPVVLDGQGAQLGQYFKVNSVPINIVVNPRTMEVLSVDVGEIADVQAYEQSFLDQLASGQ